MAAVPPSPIIAVPNVIKWLFYAMVLSSLSVCSSVCRLQCVLLRAAGTYRVGHSGRMHCLFRHGEYTKKYQNMLIAKIFG